jgi:hypothetical protein
MRLALSSHRSIANPVNPWSVFMTNGGLSNTTTCIFFAGAELVSGHAGVDTTMAKQAKIVEIRMLILIIIPAGAWLSAA